MQFLLLLIAFIGFCSADTCATAPKIPNASCIDFTTANGTQAAIYIGTNTTNPAASPQPQEPGKQLQMASFYPADPGQASITECLSGGFYEDGDATDDLAANGADCYAIWWWAANNFGFWTLTPDNLRASPWTVFIMSGDCAVLMTSPPGQKVPRWAIYVGNQDVISVVSTVLSRFLDANGKVQATGLINCPVSNGLGGEDMVETSFWIRSPKGIVV